MLRKYHDLNQSGQDLRQNESLNFQLEHDQILGFQGPRRDQRSGLGGIPQNYDGKYMINSYEPVPQNHTFQSMSSNEAAANSFHNQQSVDYSQNLMVAQTLGGSAITGASANYNTGSKIKITAGSQGSQKKNQSIDVTGKGGSYVSQGELGQKFVQGSQSNAYMNKVFISKQDRGYPMAKHSTSTLQVQHRQQSSISVTDQEYQTKKRRHNQSSQKNQGQYQRGAMESYEKHPGQAGANSSSRGNTAQSKYDTQISSHKQSSSMTGSQKQKAPSVKSSAKTTHKGSKSMMGVYVSSSRMQEDPSSKIEQMNVSHNHQLTNPTLRRSNKFEKQNHMAKVMNSSSYGAFDNGDFSSHNIQNQSVELPREGSLGTLDVQNHSIQVQLNHQYPNQNRQPQILPNKKYNQQQFSGYLKQQVLGLNENEEQNSFHQNFQSRDDLGSFNYQSQQYHKKNKSSSISNHQATNYIVNIQQKTFPLKPPHSKQLSSQVFSKATLSQERIQQSQNIPKYSSSKPTTSKSSNKMVLPIKSSMNMDAHNNQVIHQNDMQQLGVSPYSQKNSIDEAANLNQQSAKSISGNMTGSIRTMQQQQKLMQIYNSSSSVLNNQAYNSTSGSIQKKGQINTVIGKKQLKEIPLQQNYQTALSHLHEPATSSFDHLDPVSQTDIPSDFHEQIISKKIPNHQKSQSMHYIAANHIASAQNFGVANATPGPIQSQKVQVQNSLIQGNINQLQVDQNRINNLMGQNGRQANLGMGEAPGHKNQMSSYGNLDFSDQNAVLTQSVAKNERITTLTKSDKRKGAAKNNPLRMSNQEQVLLDIYKKQLSKTKQTSNSNYPASSNNVDVSASRSGLQSGEISSNTITIDHQPQKFINQTNVLQQYNNYHTKKPPVINQQQIQKQDFKKIDEHPSTSSYKSQSHMRQASLQIGPGGVSVGDMTSSTEKMAAANHRKNKSMISNFQPEANNISNSTTKGNKQAKDGGGLLGQKSQIKWNHGSMHPSGSFSKTKGTKHTRQNGDNYHDGNSIKERSRPNQTNTNFYLQFVENTDGGDSMNADSSKSLSNKGQKLKQSGTFKQHNQQSTHRKNKTTIIGYSPQKFIGLTSSTQFHRLPAGASSSKHPNLDKNQRASTNDILSGPQKKVSGTISLSQKSLQSVHQQQYYQKQQNPQESRKRVQSVDPPNGAHPSISNVAQSKKMLNGGVNTASHLRASREKKINGIDGGSAQQQFRYSSQNVGKQVNPNYSGSRREPSLNDESENGRHTTMSALQNYSKMAQENKNFNSNKVNKSSDRLNSIQKQKAHKLLQNQSSFIQKQRLKPQGNIVINPETSQKVLLNKSNEVMIQNYSYISQSHKNGEKMKSINQKQHQSILKEDLQNKKMILIGEQDYKANSSAHNTNIQLQTKSSQSKLIKKQGRSQSPSQTNQIKNTQQQSKTGINTQTINHMRNKSQSKIISSSTSQKIQTKKETITNREVSKSQRQITQNPSSYKKKDSSTKIATLKAEKQQHERHRSVAIPDQQLISINGQSTEFVEQKHIIAQNIGNPSEQNANEPIVTFHNQQCEMQQDVPMAHLVGGSDDNEAQNSDSIVKFADEIHVEDQNEARIRAKEQQHTLKYQSLKVQPSKYFTQKHQSIDLNIQQNGADEDFERISDESIRFDKTPLEQIALQIHNKDLLADNKMSPRTKEVFDMSQLIRQSFKETNEAPKTSAQFYRAGKMLGRGAFGKVCLGMHKLSRKLVALKSINKEYMSDEKSKSKVMHEVGILLRLRHQSVVQLYETFETKRHMILSMELCAGGDLLNYVRKRKKLEEPEAKVLFKQIIQGLGYIHKRKVLHRDIKLDNILLDGNGRVKIADFGVSKQVIPGEVMHEQSGTPAYIAPEILRDQGYRGFKADIWSAGIVFYAMLCGTVPFKASNMKELHKMIMKGKYHLKEEVSHEAKHLLRQMLETDPDKRISIRKILEHPWFKDMDPNMEIFNKEEKQVVSKEFVYNNPKVCNRSEKVNLDIEPWDCFTELNLDSVNQTMRNESEKSQILAPFNSSISSFKSEDYKGMEASLIIHHLFDDTSPLEDKKQILYFAARCRDQDRQYEINNNGELDNGVYHKFVYSSRDGRADDRQSSSQAASATSIYDLQPQSSRNQKNKSDSKQMFAKKGCQKTEQSQSELEGINSDVDCPTITIALSPSRLRTLTFFGYPEPYLQHSLQNGTASYCLAAYYLLGDSQKYQ